MAEAFWRKAFREQQVRADAAEARADAAEARADAAEARADAERQRADAAHALAEEERARAEELKWKEVQARSECNSWKARFKTACAQRGQARADLKALKRSRKDTTRLEAEVARLKRLLAEAKIDPRKRGTIASLRMEIGALKADLQSSQETNAALKAKIETLQSSRSNAARKTFGKKSEKTGKTPSPRNRGQQRGSKGHGRTPRPDVEETTERQELPSEARLCPSCGQPFAPNGSRFMDIYEIEIKITKRRVELARYRCQCGCPDTPSEMTAPPVPRLVKGCKLGISMWTHLLIERYLRKRPLRRIAADLTDHGMPISPGTLADNLARMRAVFDPLHAAILAHQNQQEIRHADETSWRIQNLAKHRKSQRAWLWISVSSDAVYYHVDRSRSADAAERLFGDAKGQVYLVCDRYGAYKALANRHPNITLSYCWAHCRRDIIECAAARPQLKPWQIAWRQRFATIYRLNNRRRACLGADGQSRRKGFEAAQEALEQAVTEFFATAERELAKLDDDAPQAKPLRSLVRHREGLSVFLNDPAILPDNNTAEREFRDAVIGRKLSFGSDSETGAELTATMYSVFGTVTRNGLNVGRWLKDYLDACAGNGGRPPADLAAWLPWSMTPQRRRTLGQPP